VGFPVDKLPKRYRIDESGRRVLLGLSIEETFEFETLSELALLDESGSPIPWRDGVPITSRERRCLELYQKHDAAWRALVAKHYSRRKRGDS
jgi:hypothetical protein